MIGVKVIKNINVILIRRLGDSLFSLFAEIKKEQPKKLALLILFTSCVLQVPIYDLLNFFLSLFA